MVYAIPREILDKSNNRDWLTAKDFEGRGVNLYVTNNMEIVQARNKDVGANVLDGLYKNGILKEGQTLRWSFTLEDGITEKQVETKSLAFFIGMKQIDPEIGDLIYIVASGEGKNRRYEMKIVKSANEKEEEIS